MREGRLLGGAKRRIIEFAASKAERKNDRLHAFPPVLTLCGDAQGALATAVSNAFLRANLGDSKLSAEVRAIRGMSGQKYRSTINNIIESVREPRYLEIGSWAGSTAASAIFGNYLTCLCIDNWSLFEGPKEEFVKNVNMARGTGAEFKLLEVDFRKVDYDKIGKFNIYLFDGPHEYRDHYDGVMMAQPALDDEYILIVDDWNWPDVRKGTLDALRALDANISFYAEVRTTIDDTHPEIAFEMSDWHNGYFIGVVAKRHADHGHDDTAHGGSQI